MKKSNPRKLLIVLAVFVGVIVVAGVIVHFWFIKNATSILRDVVSEQSDGRFDLKIDKLSVNYVHGRIDIKDFRLNILDSSKTKVKHTFTTSYFVLEISSITRLLLYKEMIVDSIICDLPHIELEGGEHKIKDEEVAPASVSFEIGKVYLVMQNVLSALEVKNLRIREGSFKINPFLKGRSPVDIRHINFSIKNFSLDSASATDTTKVFFSDDISLNSYNQHIIFPDNLHSLHFKQIIISTIQKKIILDSCTFTAKASDSTRSSFSIYFEQLKLVNTQFADLYLRDFIKADSIICVNPDIDFSVQITKKEKNTNKAKLTEDLLKQMIGNIDVKYIGVLNADIKVNTIDGEKSRTREAEDNSFEIHDLYINNTDTSHIMIGGLRLAFKKYESWMADSLYIVSFDSLVFDKPDLIVKNFRVMPSPQNNLPDKNSVSVPELIIKDFKLASALFDNRIEAKIAFLKNPSISLFTQADEAKKKKSGAKQPFTSILASASNLVGIETFILIDGNVDIRNQGNPNKHFEFSEVNSVVLVNKFLVSENISEMESSLQTLSFDRAAVNMGDFSAELINGVLSGNNNEITADAVNVKDKSASLSFRGKKPHITGLSIKEDSNSFHLDSLEWESGELQYTVAGKGEASKKSDAPPDISAGYIHLRNTSIRRLDLKNASIHSFLNDLIVDELSVSQETPLRINDFIAKGADLAYTTPDFTLKVKKYDINNSNNSQLSGIAFNYKKDNSSAAVTVPQIDFFPVVSTSEKGSGFILKKLNVSNPVITANIVQETTAKTKIKKKGSANAVQVENVSLKDFILNLTLQDNNGSFHVNTGKSGLSVNDIDISDGKGYTLGALKFSLADFTVNKNDSLKITASNGKLSIDADHVFIPQKGNTEMGFSGRIQSFEINNISAVAASKKNNQPLIAKNVNAGVSNIAINKASVKTLVEKMFSEQGLQFSSEYLFLPLGKSNIVLHKTSFSKNNLMFDSVRFSPVVDKDSFMKMQEWQTDYLRLSAGKTTLTGINTEAYFKDSSFSACNLQLNDVKFDIYKDKRLPFKAGVIKPLPVDILKRIPFPIKLDSVNINNASIAYSEVNEKTGAEAVIFLNRTNAVVKNIHNRDFSADDSLRLTATAFLMDSAQLRFRFNESYTDSLSAFVMYLRVRPFNLEALNPMLIPMASVRIKSGRIDTIALKAIGREYISFGEMKMYYHDLKVEFLKDADESKKTMLTGLMSFAANFVVKNENTKRKGTIFFERIRDRSFINYWLKISISGMVTSVGARANKKVLKKYKKSVKKLNVPEIEF